MPRYARFSPVRRHSLESAIARVGPAEHTWAGRCARLRLKTIGPVWLVMAVCEPASPGRQLFAPRHLKVASGRSRPRLRVPCAAGPWCRTGPTTSARLSAPMADPVCVPTTKKTPGPKSAQTPQRQIRCGGGGASGPGSGTCRGTAREPPLRFISGSGGLGGLVREAILRDEQLLLARAGRRERLVENFRHMLCCLASHEGEKPYEYFHREKPFESRKISHTIRYIQAEFQ